MRKAPEDVDGLIERTVEPMGYELVGVEFFGRGTAGKVLRVYIDSESGITLDDCVRVSRQLSAVLDVEDPIQEHYELEVSSPGLDRPLFRPEHFERFRGEKAKVRLARPLGGRRNFEGIITGIAEGSVTLEIDGEPVTLSFEDIDSARLVPSF